MSNGLPVSNLINVSVTLTPQAAQGANLNSLLILGASGVINTTERMRSYANIQQVADDFGTSAPEYFAALLYFEQSPQPVDLKIGRYNDTKSAPILYGANTAETNIAVWNAITNGSFTYVLDYDLIAGSPSNHNGDWVTVPPINFTGAPTMAAIAGAMSSTYTTCTWDAANSRFVFTGIAGVMAIANSAEFLNLVTAPRALGSITFSGNVSDGDSITLNGTVVTFKTTPTLANEVLIGATAQDTITHLYNFLIASGDTELVKFIYRISPTPGQFNIAAAATGVGGDSLTLTKSGANLIASGPTLSGGAGTSVAGLLAMTAAPAYAVPSSPAETPAQCVSLFLNRFSNQFLGIMFADTAVTDNQHIDVAALIEADQAHIYGMTTTDAAAYDSISTSDLPYRLKALGYKYSWVQYSSSNAYAVASAFGRFLTTNFNGNNTTITLMYKQEPGIAAETLTQTQAAVLKTKRCNVFVEYNNDTAIIQYGATPSGIFVDSIYNSIWFKNAIQTAVYNLLYTSPTKVPQTDAGNHLIANTITSICQQAVSNGYLAPGTWNSGGFGTLHQGDFMPTGYYVYTPLLSSQSQADREARKSVVFQVAAKEAGAIQSVDIAVLVNR